MHFVYKIDFETASSWTVLDIFQQLPRVLDLGAGSRIDFHQIDKPALVDLDAGTAFIAGSRGDASLAIQTFRQYAGQCSLAYSPGSGE